MIRQQRIPNRQADTALWRQARAALKPLVLEFGVNETASALGVAHATIGTFINGYGGINATTLDEMLQLFGLDMEIRFAPRKEEV